MGICSRNRIRFDLLAKKNGYSINEFNSIFFFVKSGYLGIHVLYKNTFYSNSGTTNTGYYYHYYTLILWMKT